MKKEEIQEEEYDFPYHHLVEIDPFSESKHLFWGYQYSAYIEKIIETLRKFDFKSLIEIGCGDGRVIKEVEKNFKGRRLMGIDYSEKSLRFAKAFSPAITFDKNTNDKFDGFILIEVLEHINPTEMNSFLGSINGKLEPGAFGIITTPSDNIPVNPKHYQHFNKISVKDTLKEYFDIVSLEYISGKGVGPNFIQKFLANRFFILNYSPLKKYLYGLYTRKYFMASEKNSSQLFIVVRKK